MKEQALHGAKLAINLGVEGPDAVPSPMDEAVDGGQDGEEWPAQEELVHHVPEDDLHAEP